MRKIRILAIFLTMIGGIVHAQDSADVEAFNDAWHRYQAAMEQPQRSLQIVAASDALEAGRKAMEPGDDRIPALMSNYGAALFLGDRKEEAQEILKDALKRSEDIHGNNAMEIVTTLFRLGDASSELYAPRRQMNYYRRALRIVATHEGKDSDEYASLALRAGISVLRLSISAEGKKYLVQAKEIFDARYGDRSMQSGRVAFQLAQLQFSDKKYDSATENLLSVLAAFEGEDEESVQYQLHARALLVQAYEERGKSDLATEHCIAIGKISKLRPNQEYQPLFRMAPSYPMGMLRNGREGYVDVAFSIDKNGFVRQPQVIDRSQGRQSQFEKAALEAVERFRYAPQFVDGKAVIVENVKTRITFELED